MKIARPVGVVLGLLGLLLFVPTAVHAVTLDHWNVSQLNAGGDYVDVGITTVSGNTTLTVQWFHVGGPTMGSNGGIDQLLYNPSTAITFSFPPGNASNPQGPPTAGPYVTGISGNAASWSFNFDGGQADGFGMFGSKTNQGNAETGGILTALVFTLNGTTAFSLNDHGASFAAHVRYDGTSGCSGWVSNGTSTSIPPASDTTNCAGVPEPASLLLVGSGLVGVGMIVARRKFGLRD